MSRTRFLQDLLSSLFERRDTLNAHADGRTIEDLCAALLSNRGEVSGKQIGSALLARFEALDEAGQLAFFTHLSNALDIDTNALQETLNDYENTHDAPALKKLLIAAEPQRQELLRRLNQVPGATGKLVAMREKLLADAKSNKDLQRADLDFKHLFASWFNRGFLVLRRISWEAPANILEKIIRYEAVHAINSWDDLRARLEPEDRRCYAFFHPAMPDEPLVFVEVALTRGTPNSIQSLLNPDRDQLQASDADTAVFYSISNCQKGLSGISFGNSLIKQVVDDLSSEWSNLSTFVTLSPVPNLARWCAAEGLRHPLGDDLPALTAHYLTRAKRGKNKPYDPVARFHLGNGARLEAVHAGADISPKGEAQSFGMMVNYLYERDEVITNHQRFAESGIVAASQKVSQLAEKGAAWITAERANASTIQQQQAS